MIEVVFVAMQVRLLLQLMHVVLWLLMRLLMQIVLVKLGVRSD